MLSIIRCRNLLSCRLLSKNLKIKIYRIIILPVVLYGFKTWSLTLREERKLRVFQNMVLRRIFGLRTDPEKPCPFATSSTVNSAWTGLDRSRASVQSVARCGCCGCLVCTAVSCLVCIVSCLVCIVLVVLCVLLLILRVLL